ncbi:DUF4235 domain-containing protein [Streptomyces lavendulae]|uniref:DUF4235 domain-containing protein n=1 Tax=Streptomyces lavendulae TaxID=1914 RepID=UPI0025559E84|nr:DUF4235 domain-containing protein [Streptomyces lavendulae]
MALGAVSGMIAGAAFQQVWKIAEGENDAPSATDENRSWKHILIAAAIPSKLTEELFQRVRSSGGGGRPSARGVSAAGSAWVT